MKKWIAILAAMLGMSALAGGIPEGAVEVEPQVYRYEIEETGEVLLLTVDEDGAPLRLETEVEGLSEGGEVDRELAEAVVREEYPGGLVLATSALEGGGREVLLLTAEVSGAVKVCGGRIVRRSLGYGEYLKDGRLTEAGALAALGLLRPGAEVEELELDREDGRLVYEGEAWLGGVEYEFELEATVGRLIEWQAD